MRFADPRWLLLLAVPIGWAIWRWRQRAHPPAEHVAFPTLAFLDDAPRTARERWRWLPELCRGLGLALLVVALARPQVTSSTEKIHIRSRNIMLALDISSSMKAGDFQPGNRILVGRRLQQLVPAISHHDVFVCGPPAFTTAATVAVRAAGVPTRHIHAEQFAF